MNCQRNAMPSDNSAPLQSESTVQPTVVSASSTTTIQQGVIEQNPVNLSAPSTTSQRPATSHSRRQKQTVFNALSNGPKQKKQCAANKNSHRSKRTIQYKNAKIVDAQSVPTSGGVPPEQVAETARCDPTSGDVPPEQVVKTAQNEPTSGDVPPEQVAETAQNEPNSTAPTEQMSKSSQKPKDVESNSEPINIIRAQNSGDSGNVEMSPEAEMNLDVDPIDTLIENMIEANRGQNENTDVNQYDDLMDIDPFDIDTATLISNDDNRDKNDDNQIERNPKRPLLVSNSDDVETKDPNTRSNPPQKMSKPTVDLDLDSDEEVLEEFGALINTSFVEAIRDTNVKSNQTHPELSRSFLNRNNTNHLCLESFDSLADDTGYDIDVDDDATPPIGNIFPIPTPPAPHIGTVSATSSAGNSSVATNTGTQSVVHDVSPGLRRSERRTRCKKNFAEVSSDDGDDDVVTTQQAPTSSSSVRTRCPPSLPIPSVTSSTASSSNSTLGSSANPITLNTGTIGAPIPRPFRKRSRSTRPMTPTHSGGSQVFQETVASRNQGRPLQEWRFAMINYGSIHVNTKGNIPGFSYYHRFRYAKIHNDQNKKLPLNDDKRHIIPFHVDNGTDYDTVMRVARVEHWADYFNSTRMARSNAEFVFPWVSVDSTLKLLMLATKIAVDGAQAPGLDWKNYLSSNGKLHEAFECNQTRKRVYMVVNDSGKRTIKRLVIESGYDGDVDRE